MVGFPNNHGFPTRNDHFGVFWVYHHLRKHPNNWLEHLSHSDCWQGDCWQGPNGWHRVSACARKTTACGCGCAEHWTSCLVHGSFFFEAFISFQKWVLPAVSSGIAVDSGPNIALETCLFVFFACWQQRLTWHNHLQTRFPYIFLCFLQWFRVSLVSMSWWCWLLFMALPGFPSDLVGTVSGLGAHLIHGRTVVVSFSRCFRMVVSKRCYQPAARISQSILWILCLAYLVAQDSTDVRSQLKLATKRHQCCSNQSTKNWWHNLAKTHHARVRIDGGHSGSILCTTCRFEGLPNVLCLCVVQFWVRFGMSCHGCVTLLICIFFPHAFVLQHSGLGESTGFLLVDINLVTTKTTCFLNKNDSGDPNKLSKNMVAESTKRNHGYVQNHRLSRVLMPPQVNLNKYYAIDCFCLVSIFAACFVVSDPNVQPMQFPGIQSVATTPLTSWWNGGRKLRGVSLEEFRQ